MVHIDEHTLEMLILEPERFQPAERAVLAAHISVCPGCHAVHEDLMTLHGYVRESQGQPTPSLVAAMKRIFARGTMVSLTPYHPHLQVPAGGSYSGILAAMAPESMSQEGFETVATYASEVNHILLRVRQDASNRRVKLYYHADDPLCQLGPVVTLPALDADAVIDDQGRAEFHIEAPRTPREWSQAEALVAFPVCSAVRAEDGTVHVENTPGHSYDVSLEPSGALIGIRCSDGPTMPGIRRAVIWSAEGLPLLVGLTGGRASFLDPAPGRKLVIRLYT